MQKVAVGEICKIVSSGGTPSRKKPEYFTLNSSGHLWVKSKELLDSSIDDTEEKITDEAIKNSSAKYYPANTVLMAMYGANVGQLGWLKRPATVNQAVCGIVVDENLANFRYLFYTLLHTRPELVTRAQGAAQQNLNQNLIKGFKIPLTSLPTQRKIAAILSAYDDLIENNLRRIKVLEEMTQLIYREWFVNFRFPGHEDVKMVDSVLGEIPEGWDVKKLGKITNQARRNVKPEQVDSETPYFGLEHIPRQSITLSKWSTVSTVKSTKLAFKKGEILFGKIRPYFHKVGVAPVDGLCSSDTIVISPKSPEFFPIVLGCVSSGEFVAHATATSQGTKMPRANWDVLAEYPISIPPQQLLNQFNRFMNDTINQLRNLMFQNINLRQTRDLLLPKLISGVLDVSELEINTGEEVS